MIINYFKSLSTPESSGKKLGLFRVTCSIFGGLIAGYLSMIFLALIIPSSIEESSVISIMFNTLAWAAFATYIALAHTKLSALLRFLVPTLIFALFIFILKGV